METMTWSIHTSEAGYRSRHRDDALRLTFEAGPLTLRGIRYYIISSYRATLNAFVYSRTQPGAENPSRRDLILIWRGVARNVVVNAAFAAHLANSTNYHRTEESAA